MASHCLSHKVPTFGLHFETLWHVLYPSRVIAATNTLAYVFRLESCSLSTRRLETQLTLIHLCDLNIKATSSGTWSLTAGPTCLGLILLSYVPTISLLISLSFYLVLQICNYSLTFSWHSCCTGRQCVDFHICRASNSARHTLGLHKHSVSEWRSQLKSQNLGTLVR